MKIRVKPPTYQKSFQLRTLKVQISLVGTDHTIHLKLQSMKASTGSSAVILVDYIGRWWIPFVPLSMT